MKLKSSFYGELLTLISINLTILIDTIIFTHSKSLPVPHMLHMHLSILKRDPTMRPPFSCNWPIWLSIRSRCSIDLLSLFAVALCCYTELLGILQIQHRRHHSWGWIFHMVKHCYHHQCSGRLILVSIDFPYCALFYIF